MIENRQFRLNRFDVIGTGSLTEVIERWVGADVLRWYIAQVTDHEIVVEATFSEGEPQEPAEGLADRRHYPGKSVALSIIPTGVGCELGGYAGDAAPATNLLAATVDYLVTNPNAVNASNFISLDDNVLYTEGLCIDRFVKGEVDLAVPYANRVGLVIEKSSPGELDMIYNVVNTVRAVHGVDIVDCVVTDEPIGSRCVENGSGAFVGTVDHPEVLFAACERLIQQGATALAITTRIQDVSAEDHARHFAGEYPNPLGGVEAVLSHLVVRRFRLPAAHAPLVNSKDLELEHEIVDARGAGEMASASGLACTLIGLRRAPQIRPRPCQRCRDVVNVHNLLALVTPANTLGGIPAIYAHKYGVPIIAVADNRTVLGVSKEKVGMTEVIDVRSYAEAAGVLLALRRGIHLDSIRRPLPTFRHRQGRGAHARRAYREQFA